jgi:hypothetical protein
MRPCQVRNYENLRNIQANNKQNFAFFHHSAEKSRGKQEKAIDIAYEYGILNLGLELTEEWCLSV